MLIITFVPLFGFVETRIQLSENGREKLMHLYNTTDLAGKQFYVLYFLNCRVFTTTQHSLTGWLVTRHGLHECEGPGETPQRAERSTSGRKYRELYPDACLPNVPIATSLDIGCFIYLFIYLFATYTSATPSDHLLDRRAEQQVCSPVQPTHHPGGGHEGDRGTQESPRQQAQRAQADSTYCGLRRYVRMYNNR